MHLEDVEQCARCDRDDIFDKESDVPSIEAEGKLLKGDLFGDFYFQKVSVLLYYIIIFIYIINIMMYLIHILQYMLRYVFILFYC